jgi:phospho-N-acetylmuramoyl-pentapeptide-transferase
MELVMGNGTMLWFAALASLVLALAFGAVLVPWLRYHNFGQPIRAAGPESHREKQGTPTMGGLIFVLPGFAVALGVHPGNLSVWALAFLTMVFMAIGLMDDYVKLGKKRALGLKARQKLAAQIIVSGLFAWFAARYLGAAGPWALPWGGRIQPGGGIIR